MVTKPIHTTAIKAKSLLAKLSGQPKAPAIINISELLVLQGETDSALKRLGDVRDTYANSYRYHLVVARANREAGKYDDARQHYEVACRLAPQNEVAIKELIELRSLPITRSIWRPSAVTPATPYDTETLEQEELHKDDLFDGQSHTAEDFDANGVESALSPEMPELAPASTAGLFLDEAGEEIPAPAESLDEEEPVNIFESGIEGANEADRMEDLFLPENEGELDLEQMQQEAISDLFSSSSFSPEALQREAIRQIEEELGPISEDPFVDFDAVLPAEKKTDADYAKEPETPFSGERSKADAGTNSGLFDQSDEQAGLLNDEDQQLLFVGYDDEPSSPKGYVADTDEDDLADFKIDREKLGRALGKLRSQTEGRQPNRGQVAPVTKQSPAKPGDRKTGSGIPARANQATTEPLSDVDPLLDDIDRLAADLSKLKFRPVVETNDPTPISEQRQPYSDDEEIKAPTRSLAQIFASQGAYAKAIKVYQALIENDPENAVEYEAEIEAIQQQMNGE